MSKFIRNWHVVCLQGVLKFCVKMSGNLRRSHKLVQASADLYVVASQCEIAIVLPL
jgi:hypothetical protein